MSLTGRQENSSPSPARETVNKIGRASRIQWGGPHVPADRRATVLGRAYISKESAGKIARLSAGTAARPTNEWQPDRTVRRSTISRSGRGLRGKERARGS